MELSELIYDRTEEDVEVAKNNPASEDYEKGAYNYTDLNRVEEWVYYLKYLLKDLDYDVSEIVPKMGENTYTDLTDAVYSDYTDDYDYEKLKLKEVGGWAMSDIPTYDDFKNRYINNIEILKNFFPTATSELESIDFDGTLNYEQANLIEEILYIVNENYDKNCLVTVNYLDSSGNAIADSTVLTGAIGEEYTIEPEEEIIYNKNYYIYSTSSVDLTGTFSAKAITINLIYMEKYGTISYYCLDDSGNQIHSGFIFNGLLVGSEYTLKAPTIDGYTYVSADPGLTIIIAEGTNEITLYYTSAPRFQLDYTIASSSG